MWSKITSRSRLIQVDRPSTFGKTAEPFEMRLRLAGEAAATWVLTGDILVATCIVLPLMFGSIFGRGRQV
jgi:hypothetical protein